MRPLYVVESALSSVAPCTSKRNASLLVHTRSSAARSRLTTPFIAEAETRNDGAPDYAEDRLNVDTGSSPDRSIMVPKQSAVGGHL
jgi:hypothetical protein